MTVSVQLQQPFMFSVPSGVMNVENYTRHAIIYGEVKTFFLTYRSDMLNYQNESNLFELLSNGT